MTRAEKAAEARAVDAEKAINAEDDTEAEGWMMKARKWMTKTGKSTTK